MPFATLKLLVCAALLLMMGMVSTALAQDSNTCPELLDEAETQYVDARFDQTIQLVDECLRRDDVTRGDIIGSYRLLALSYIRMDQLGDARMAVLHLLNQVPDYRPDAIGDPPDYTVLVESVRAQFTPEAQPETRSWFSANSRWLIGGGAALLGGVFTAILLQNGGGGSGGTNDGGLPPPPNPPN